MNIENLSKEERLEHFKELYENAKNGYSPNLDAFEKYMNQYKGSCELDGSENRAVTVRNITYEMIESQISSDIPPPKVDTACYSERRSRCAKSIERLLYSVRDKLRYEEMNDIDERYTYIYGGSVWYAEWDNEIRLGKEIGGVRLYCLPPRCFIPQPAVYSVQDMEYCFLTFTTTKDEAIRKYSIKKDDVCKLDTDCDGNDDGACVNLVIAFYKDSDGHVGRFIFSGEAAILDMPRAYERKELICKRCARPAQECDCESPSLKSISVPEEMLPREVFYPDGAPNTAEISLYGRCTIPYYMPKSFPIVIRKNTSADGMLFGQSDCEYIRPEQQAINKIESRILQKLLRAGVTPVVPEDATVSINNSVFGQVIKMKPGESLSQYGKVDTTPDISQDIAEAERLYDHSKRILGISDALQGLDTAKNESGYSRQLRISQATGRLESKRKMKHTAYADVDRIIFELYLAFADEPRALVYKDAYGRVHNASFNRYDFIELDAKSGELYYDDAYLFSVDLNAGAEYQREALWQRNLENLKAGTLGDPTSPVTLLRYWQCQERAHYPYARENVEYFTLAIEGDKPYTEGVNTSYGNEEAGDLAGIY